MRNVILYRLGLTLLMFCLAGCSSTGESTSNPGTAKLHFEDVTERAGINWKHNNGAFGLKFTPETMGSGVAFIDADSDGYQDILLVNSRDWTAAEVAAYKNGNGRKHFQQRGFVAPPQPQRRRSVSAFYRNNGDGTFQDVTQEAGFDIEMFGMGAAVGDYDNDGKADIYVTGYGRNYLLQNQSSGKVIKFREVAATAGVMDRGWSASAAWVDYNKDGRLDLFVSHYFKWAPAIDAYRVNVGPKIYTGPDHYKPDINHLYQNQGNGKFSNVSQQSGIAKSTGKALGVAICDFNNDLWPDIAVANDRVANQLFQNNKNGTFSELGEQVGIAYSTAGQARAGMGIDAADINHSNRESLVITNFSTEMIGLYANTGEGLFTDVANDAGIAQASLPFIGFGCSFTDFDLDGWPDIIVTNGDVFDDSEGVKRDPSKPYAQRMLLFRNQGTSSANAKGALGGAITFEEITSSSGDALMQSLVGRGLACADIDLDGDADVIVTANGGPAKLLKNNGGNANNAIRVELIGAKSNRSAVGTIVWAVIGEDRVRRVVRSGSSYLSQNELPLTLGLGKQTKATLMIRWPSDKLMELKDVEANQIITVDENKGIVQRKPLKRD